MSALERMAEVDDGVRLGLCILFMGFEGQQFNFQTRKFEPIKTE